MKMKQGYGNESASMKPKGGGAKNASAYSEKAGQGAAGARKGAKLDSTGGTSKKNDGQYKEHCKDE